MDGRSGGLPAALAAAVPAVEAALATALRDLAAELVSIDPALADAGDALTEANADGKRLRPALVCWAYSAQREAMSGDAADVPTDPADLTDVLGPAVALELVHACALIHDDVIDRSDTRRGRPSLHARFAALHGPGWTGTAPDHGRSVAILLGDVALAAADAHLLRAHVGPAALARAHDAFTRLRIEVMAGQFLDVDAAARGSADRERALRIATLKSGRYSVSRPLELGALLAGADDATAAALRAVGDPLGVAFQLGDDLLGVFGDPAETGKPVASDLAEGKRTLLVAETLTRADAVERAAFVAGFGQDGLDASTAAQLRAIVTECGARAAVEDEVRVHVDRAHRAIDVLPLSVGRRSELHELAGWLVARQR
jgi:geranylgeranyl diphosphate synthase, type I